MLMLHLLPRELLSQLPRLLLLSRASLVGVCHTAPSTQTYKIGQLLVPGRPDMHSIEIIALNCLSYMKLHMVQYVPYG